MKECRASNSSMDYFTPWISLTSSIGNLDKSGHAVFIQERTDQEINANYSIPSRDTEWL